jgi:hypothetical protein
VSGHRGEKGSSKCANANPATARLGGAAVFHPLAHPQDGYDLRIDTARLTPRQAAQATLEAEGSVKRSAFRRF